MSEPRKTFGPVVLAGLVGAGFAAIAGHQTLLKAPDEETLRLAAMLPEDSGAQFPLAGALGLVALACWGVLLVTRGIVRRVVAGLALASAVGILAVLVIGGFFQREDAAADMADRLGAVSSDAVSLSPTWWFWVGLASTVLAIAAAAAALRFTPVWPEMGSRYDAPTLGSSSGAERLPDADLSARSEQGEQSNLDLWKAFDEGSDPTADPGDRSD